MTRHILTTVLAALAAVAVGAQGPTALQPELRGKLYKKNRVVIERLVEKTVASSRSSADSIKRAESYYDVLFEFNQAIARAKADQDTARVTELTNHLNALLARGLAPTLHSARRTVEGGTGQVEYERARDSLVLQVDALLHILANDPVTSAALQTTRATLVAKIGK